MPYRHGRCAILDLCERYDTDPSSFRLKFRRDVPAQACQTDGRRRARRMFSPKVRRSSSVFGSTIAVFFAMSASVIWRYEFDNTY